MRSHSFQDTELKLYRYVNDPPGQVVGGVIDSTVPRGVKKRLITQKNVNSTCVRTVFKIQS